MDYSRNLANLSSNDTSIAGGKGASLGEMTGAGLAVPSGFVILSSTFDIFLRDVGLLEDIEAILRAVDHTTVHSVEHASEKIQALITSATMPEPIVRDIYARFADLDTEFVAVRSSATAEDGKDHAWAGQLDSYLNVTKSTLVERVQHCWASLFTPRAIFYRFEKGLHATHISVAVVVQKMVNSEKSGIAFSVHPVTEDRNQLIIEAGYGLGEAVVSGQITPDSYVVSKHPREIIDIHVSEQSRALYRNESGGNIWKELHEKGKEQVLNEKEIFTLSEHIMRIENHYGFPCDIEWAYEDGKFYITQSRPITTLSNIDISDTSGANDDTRPDLLAMFLGEVGSHEILTIRGKYAPLFTATWILKNGDFPLYMADTKKESLFGFDLEVYKGYATETFRRYLQKKFDLKKFEVEYYKNVAELDTYYTTYVHESISGLSEDRLITLVQKVQNVFDTITSDSLFIEFLTPDIIKTVLVESGYSTNSTEMLENLGRFPFDSFEKRHENSKIEALTTNKGKIDLRIINSLKYLYTDYQRTKSEGEIEKDLEQYKNKERHPVPDTKERDHYVKGLSKEDRYVFDYVEFITHLRDYRKDHLAKAQALLQIIGTEFSIQAGIDTVHTMNILPTEMVQGIEYLKGQKDDIVARQDGLEAYSYSKEKVFIHASSPDINSIDATFAKSHGIKDTEVLRGDAASRGSARGRVKIIFDATQDHDFPEGSVLVTSMTRPEFVPLMKKASAIVTNEGGITCHAAIVSRELSKPCVIGTRIATQVLKDGDLVEVDADKGEVRVLEKNEHFNFREDEYEYVWGGTGFSMLFMDLFFSAIGRFPFFEQFCVSENNEMQVYVSKKTFLECSRYVHTNLSSSEQIHNFCINAHACADAFGSLDVSLPLPLLWEKFVSLSNNFLFEYSKLDPYFSDEIVITKDGKENIVYLGQQKNELREKLNAIYFAEDSIFSRILNRISGECCIDRETLYCSSSEDVLKKSENPHLEMKGSTGFVLHMSDGKVRYTKDSRHVVLVKEIFSKDHIQQGCGRVFPGTSVSKRGIYKGKVKKITLNYLSLQKTIDEINQVRGGYVLVTDHTTPELLPAMKKAIAIVADMGGLLSHAAITSRELDLPCIVGTKCAAQVLHDGDLVEVDADKGELRVVERKKAFDPQESTFEAQQRGTKHASSETYDRLAQLGLWDKEKWYEQGRWIQSPFVYTFFSHWYKKNIVKRVVPELSFHTTFSIDGYAFVSNEDAEHLSAYIKKGYQDKTLGLLVQRIDKEGKAISRKVLDMLEKDNKYLREHMDEFINLYKEFAAFWCVEAYIGDHIIRASKELGYITSESELFGKVHPYLRKTWIEGEAEEIKRIAINVMDGHREDVQTRLRIYLEKYSWIKIAKWLGEPMTMEQAQERLQEEIVNYQQGNYIHPDIVQEEPDDIVRLSVATAYWRAECGSIEMQAALRLRPLLVEFGERFGFGYEKALLFSPDELVTFFQDSSLTIDVPKLMEREKGFFSIVDNNDNEIIIDQNIREYQELKKLYLSFDVSTTSDILSGVSASGGKVQGSVRVVNSMQEAAWFEDGDILVAPETTPSFVPLMRKASAILTGKGGITSHAAIVSRELKKPCIIAIKDVTRILKTGDLVEVDADKGEVRVVERGNLYTKQFTREYSLPIIESWCYGESTDSRQYDTNQQPYLPYIVFANDNGLVTCYMDERGINHIRDVMRAKYKEDPDYSEVLRKTFTSKLTRTKLCWDRGSITPQDVPVVLREIRDAWPWFEAFWWALDVVEREEDKKKLLALRSWGEGIGDTTDKLLKKCLKDMYVDLGDLAHYISYDELLEKKLPSTETLSLRKRQYVVIDGQVITNKNRADIERAYSITFEKPSLENKNVYHGQVACKGKVQGIVRICRTASDAKQIKDGEILVAYTTTPEYMPGIKSAAALIAEEGGIVSHTAIVARELNKPAIIGIKFITELLKTGDLVEVDADKGEVRVVERVRQTDESMPLTKDNTVFTFESMGTSFIFQDLVFKHHMHWGSITLCRGNNVRVFVPKDEIKRMHEEGKKFTRVFLEEKVNTIQNICNDIKNSIHDLRGKKTFTQESLKDFFIPLEKLCDAYSYFDINYSDGMIRGGVLTPSGKYIEETKNILREALNFPLFENNGWLLTGLGIVSNQFNVPTEILEWYTQDEIISLFDGKKVSSDEIASRQLSYAYYLTNQGVGRLITGLSALEYFELFADHIDGFSGVLRGTLVHRGEGSITGVVRILKRKYSDPHYLKEGMDKMNKGEILVTDTTDPDFLPAIKKAGAIITDIGGMLSHASITSRELNKLCIVGTRYASKVLQDGDLVEVDADKGEVRVVERKKAFDPQEWTFEAQQRGGHPILMADLWCQALYSELPRAINLPVNGLDYACTSEYRFYYKGTDREEMLKQFSEKLEDEKYFTYILEETKKAVRVFHDHMESIPTDPSSLSHLSDIQLADTWEYFIRASRKFVPWYFIPWYITEYNMLSNKVFPLLEKYQSAIEKITEYNNAIAILMFPQDEMEFQKEQKALYGLVKKVQDGKQLNEQEISSYLDNFGWMTTFILAPLHPLTKEGLLEKVTTLAKSNNDDYLLQEANRKKNKDIFTSLAKVFPKKGELSTLLERARDLAWVLTWGVESSLKDFASVIPLHLEVSKRIDLSYEDFTLLTIDEIKKSILAKKSIVSVEDLASRRDAFVFSMERGVQTIITGTAAKEIIQGLTTEYKKNFDETSTFIVGKGAVAGYARGRVVVANSAQEASVLQDGEILVTTMTTPDYVPAMKRSGAIVTNEGGLLCHAAIIARELGTPCVIATKYATHILKTGDLVEVDADKGEVRVVERGDKVVPQEIISESWTKNWEGKFSLLFSLIGLELSGFHKFFGVGPTRALLFYSDGISTCYFVDNEMETFGSGLCFQVQAQPKLLDEWIMQTKSDVDAIYKLTEQLPQDDSLENITRLMHRFGLYMFALKEMGNYASGEFLQDITPKLVDVRKYAETLYFDISEYISSILVSISSSSDISVDLLECLTPEECTHYYKDRTLPPVSVLSQRRIKSLVYFDPKPKFITDQKDLIENALIKHDSQDIIVGQIAYSGVFRGCVRVIRKFDTNTVLHTGEILVTGMTDPRFVPLMKQVGAIVTDAGGMLCHAAIVARELKKPCIVGTKFATQVLKDGDLVEVDADKGEVRVVERGGEGA